MNKNLSLVMEFCAFLTRLTSVKFYYNFDKTFPRNASDTDDSFDTKMYANGLANRSYKGNYNIPFTWSLTACHK